MPYFVKTPYIAPSEMAPCSIKMAPSQMAPSYLFFFSILIFNTDVQD